MSRASSTSRRASRSSTTGFDETELQRAIALSKKHVAAAKTPKSARGRANVATSSKKSTSTSTSRSPSRTRVVDDPVVTPSRKSNGTSHSSSSSYSSTLDSNPPSLAAPQEPLIHSVLAFLAWAFILAAFAYAILLTIDRSYQQVVEGWFSKIFSCCISTILKGSSAATATAGAAAAGAAAANAAPQQAAHAGHAHAQGGK